MFLGNHQLGTVGQLSFSVSLKDDGEVDAPLAPDGSATVAIGFEHRNTDKAGYFLCRIDADSIPAVCRDIVGFFDTNKGLLCEKALAALRSN
jgi:hypothetical protein